MLFAMLVRPATPRQQQRLPETGPKRPRSSRDHSSRRRTRSSRAALTEQMSHRVQTGYQQQRARGILWPPCERHPASLRRVPSGYQFPTSFDLPSTPASRIFRGRPENSATLPKEARRLASKRSCLICWLPKFYRRDLAESRHVRIQFRHRLANGGHHRGRITHRAKYQRHRVPWPTHHDVGRWTRLCSRKFLAVANDTYDACLRRVRGTVEAHHHANRILPGEVRLLKCPIDNDHQGRPGSWAVVPFQIPPQQQRKAHRFKEPWSDRVERQGSLPSGGLNSEVQAVRRPPSPTPTASASRG